MHWCTYKSCLIALTCSWNLNGILTNAEYGSITGRCSRSWGFGIKINCSCVCFRFFFCVFLDLINHLLNPRHKWDYFIYFILDIWLRFPALRALMLGNIVAVVVLMCEAAYASLMLFRIGVRIWIKIWIGIYIALKGCKYRVIGSSGRRCRLLYTVVFFKFFN